MSYSLRISYSLVRFPLESVAKVRTFSISASMLQNIFSHFLNFISKRLIIGLIENQHFFLPPKGLFRALIFIYAHVYARAHMHTRPLTYTPAQYYLSVFVVKLIHHIDKTVRTHPNTANPIAASIPKLSIRVPSELPESQ